MRVIATATGFDGKRIQPAGAEFEVPDGSKASWFKPAESAKVGKARKSEAADAAASEPKGSDGLV